MPFFKVLNCQQIFSFIFIDDVGEKEALNRLM